MFVKRKVLKLVRSKRWMLLTVIGLMFAFLVPRAFSEIKDLSIEPLSKVERVDLLYSVSKRAFETGMEKRTTYHENVPVFNEDEQVLNIKLLPGS